MSKIGIIGGSAIYDIEGHQIVEQREIKTPFGYPSDELVIGKFAGKDVVFLPRHGKGHKILPTEINNRANIYALKTLGVDMVISVSAVGSLKEEIRPLDFVLPDQFVDRTNQARGTTFFGEGIVAHIPFAEPVCSHLRKVIYENNHKKDVRIHDGGTYLNMEGPAFSTKAESFLYKSWGMDIIGMTNMPEARLAREAGMCYATIAMVTDYDCWYMGPDVESVTVEIVVENIKKNVEAVKKVLRNTVKNMPERRTCKCKETLKHSIITRREDIPEKTLEVLKPIIQGFI